MIGMVAGVLTVIGVALWWAHQYRQHQADQKPRPAGANSAKTSTNMARFDRDLTQGNGRLAQLHPVAIAADGRRWAHCKNSRGDMQALTTLWT